MIAINFRTEQEELHYNKITTDEINFY